MLVVIIILKDTTFFQYYYSFSVLCLENITAVEINSAFTYLKV